MNKLYPKEYLVPKGHIIPQRVLTVVGNIQIP